MTKILTPSENKRKPKKAIKKTAQTYREIVKRYESSVGKTPLSKESICMHLETLKALQRSSSTINLDCKMLCSQYVSESPTLEDRVKREKESESIKKSYLVKVTHEDYKKKALQVHEVEKLMDELPIKLSLIVKTLVNHGLRISELISLHNSRRTFLSGYYYFKFVGKGNKEREIFLSEEDLHEIKEVFGENENDFLFTTRDGNQFNRTYISRELSKYGKRILGEEFSIHAHTFRHTWTTHSLNNGESIEAVQRYGGWADPSFLLRHYAHNSIEPGKQKFAISKKRIMNN